MKTSKFFNLTLGVCLLLGLSSMNMVSANGATPEACFGFADGTITSYNAGMEWCGIDVVIPEMINSTNVTSI